MKKPWNITKLIATGSLGVLLLVLSLGGATIASVTGIPGTSGIINMFVSGIMFVVCVLLIRKFGAATIMSFIYSVLALPLALYGTPGFLPKVLIGIGIGLIADVLYLGLKRQERVASLVIGGVTQLLIPISIIFLGRLFGMPGLAELEKLFLSVPMASAVLIIGAIAGYLGWLIYSRIKNSNVVVRIQGG
jgi:hypothetical protein